MNTPIGREYGSLSPVERERIPEGAELEVPYGREILVWYRDGRWVDSEGNDFVPAANCVITEWPVC